METKDDDKYFCDQYDSVYEIGENANYFVGKLNGRKLDQFILDIEEMERHQFMGIYQ